MKTSTANRSVVGVAATVAIGARPGRGSRPSGADLFGRCVSLYQEAESLELELRAVARNLAAARAYLDSADGNKALADARLVQLMTRRSAALARLRANRLQARALLARIGSPTLTDVA